MPSIKDESDEKQLQTIGLTFASFETAGLEGNSTFRALIIVSSRNIRS